MSDGKPSEKKENHRRERFLNSWSWLGFGIFIIALFILFNWFYPPIKQRDEKDLLVFSLLIIGILVFVTGIVKYFCEPYKGENSQKPPPVGDKSLRPAGLLAQYKENQKNQRVLLRLLWEIPTIAVAISSAFLVAAYNFFPDNTTVVGSINNSLTRCLLLSLGSLLMFVSFLAVAKHRYYRGVWLDAIGEIEKKMNLDPFPMYIREHKKTESYKKTNAFHKIFIPLSVETLLANVIFLISIIFTVLAVFNLWQYFHPIV
jgi:hypothetical protein